jgi:hypothetical protein
MDGNSIITVLALFVSVFALISEERRTDISIRLLHSISGALGVFLFFIILYFLYWDFIDAQGWHKIIPTMQFPKGFDEKYALLTTVILFIAFTATLISRPPRFFINHTSKWVIESNRLLNEGKFKVLSYLLSTYAVDQIKIINRKSCACFSQKQKDLRDQTIHICNNNEFIRFLSTNNPYTVKKLIMAEINEDIISIFIEEQIKSQHSLFYKGLDEDSESKNPAANRFMNEIIKSRYFSQSEQSSSILEAILKVTFTPEEKDNLNKSFSPYDTNKKENWSNPIRLSGNFYQKIYQTALRKNGVYTPNAYDLAIIGKNLLDSINRSTECDLTHEHPARIDHLLWEVEHKYSQLIYDFRNEKLNLFHKDIIEAYGYLIRNIILNDKISDSSKLKSLVRAINCCNLNLSIENIISNSIKKDHAGSKINDAVINDINKLYNQEKNLMVNQETRDTMSINKIPDLFPCTGK